MKNIELFDEYTATILAELYQAFPVKVSLNACKISGHSEYDEFGRVLNERGEPSKQFEIAKATIEWLWETGYIRAPDMQDHGISYAVLSPMGLAVLKSVPESIQIKETTGDRLAKLVKEGSFDGARDLVKSALSAGVSFAVSSATG